MVFFVGNRFEKNVSFQNEDGSDFLLSTRMDVYWVFQFANNENRKIEGTVNTVQNAASFDVPDNFFTLARVGKLCHQYYVESNSIPKIQSVPIDDVLIKNKLTPAEITLVEEE